MDGIFLENKKNILKTDLKMYPVSFPCGLLQDVKNL